MPINSGTKKLWWQKLVSKKSKDPTIQRWKNLSPDEPPLPFLVNTVVQSSIKSSEPDLPVSEIAPTKNQEFIPSASLYITPDQLYPTNRNLYTIHELSEINTTGSISSNNRFENSSHDDSVPPTPPIVEQAPTVVQTSVVKETPAIERMNTIEQPPFMERKPIIEHSVEKQVSAIARPPLTKPLISRDIHITKQTPIVKEKLIVEQTPIVKEKSIVEQTQAVEQTPIAKQTPILKKATTSIQLTSETDAKVLFRSMLRKRMNDKENHPTKLRLQFNEENNIKNLQFISQTRTRHNILFNGTPQSIPPELLICDTYSHESTNVWALGISLYHMLVGKYPFDEDITHMELFNQMLDPNFVTIPDTLSVEVQDLLKNMLMPDPNKRSSFQFIQSHPWFVKPKKLKRKKALQIIKKVTKFVLKGPYPPPS